MTVRPTEPLELGDLHRMRQCLDRRPLRPLGSLLRLMPMSPENTMASVLYCPRSAITS